MKLVQAWSGKWHQFQSEVKIIPATDASASGYWNRIPKPERLQVLTTCGERVMLKNEADDFEPALTPSGYLKPPMGMRNMCKKCWPVIVDNWQNSP